MDLPGALPRATRALSDTEPPEDWVPLDRRWLGMDRSKLPYALGALAVAFVMALVLPWLDAATPNPYSVRSGDVLRFGSGVTVQPPVGWAIESGGLGTENRMAWPGQATLTQGGTVLTIKVAPFSGDNATLLADLRARTDALNGQSGFHVVGAPAGFTTGQGVAGLLSRFESPGAVGLLAVAVSHGVGVKVAVTGVQTLGRDTVADVAGVLDTLAFAEGK